MADTTAAEDKRRGRNLLLIALGILVVGFGMSFMFLEGMNAENQGISIKDITQLIAAIAALITAITGLLKVISGFRKQAAGE